MGAVTLSRLVANHLVVDALVAGGLTAMAQGQLPHSASAVQRLLLTVATGVLAFRRRRPLLTAVMVAAAIGAVGLTADPPSVFGEYLAVMLAAYTVAERRGWLGASLGGLALAGGVVGHDLRSSEYGSPAGIASDLAIPVVIWLVGRVVHLQRARADRSRAEADRLGRDRQELAQAAVATERAQLARELHDVVTHSVSVVVIQAQGAQRLLADREPEVREALLNIETAGRSALTEMRRLLGLIRDDEQALALSPQPGLRDLGQLVRQVRAAGLPVELVGDGEPADITAGVGLSAYRVVQEALTNTLRYADANSAVVAIRHHSDGLEVTVTDDGRGFTDGPTSIGGGRGQLGLRERVISLGGTFEADRLDAGDYRVRAWFPLEPSGADPAAMDGGRPA